MNNVKSIDKIINSETEIKVRADFTTFSIRGNKSVRYGVEPLDVYRIIWTCVNPEWEAATGEDEEPDYYNDTIAMVEIRAANFDDFNQAIDYMDECNQETYDETLIAETYFKRFPKRCRRLKEDYGFIGSLGVYDLHTLYISPKYRNKGIAKVIVSQLSELLRQLGRSDGIITAYINPFKRTDIELPNDLEQDPFKKSFDNDELIEYSNLETEESGQMAEVMRKLFEDCGFSKMDDRYYAVSTEYLKQKAVNRKFLAEDTYSTWEHR